MSETPAEYHTTPPLLRPLNPQEHREVKLLNDALTQAKISLNDRHAELRMMRVGVEELTKRALKAEGTLDETWKFASAFRHKLEAAELDAEALHTESKSLRIAITATTSRAEKAEARVKEQQAELAEQEKQTLLLLKERAVHKNNGRFPLCLICENGPALCECSPLPKKKK